VHTEQVTIESMASHPSAVMLHVEHHNGASQPSAQKGVVSTAVLVQIPIGAICVNPMQPRRVFAEEPLADLVESIKRDGILQPLLVRVTEHGYELVAGERRLRAAITAGLTEVPATVANIPDQDMLRLAIVENVLRESLNLIEEGTAYKQLMMQAGCTQAEVAELVGKSRQHVGHVLGLQRLTAPVQRKVAAGVLTLGHARALVAIPDPYVAERLATRIIAEGLSVRSVEEIVTIGNLQGAEEEPKSRQRNRPREKDLSLPPIAESLSDWLDTRVTVLSGRSRGKIVINFADKSDLHRLIELLGKGRTDTAAH